MYDKCFNEYYVSENELKAKICCTIKSLSLLHPEEFSPNLLSCIIPQQDTATFLQNLANLVPIIQNVKKDFKIVTEIEALRISAIALDSYHYSEMLEPILLKLIGLVFARQLICFRYLTATDIIEKLLEEDLKYDSRLLYEELMNPRNPEDNSIYESLLAQEEIARVSNNEKVKDFFWASVLEFETSIEDYVKQGLPSIVFEMFHRVFFEAAITNLNPLDAEDRLTSEDKKELLRTLAKMPQKSTNFRLGVKHGGVREREGFTWNREEQIKFYKMVESIPKIDRKKKGVKEAIYVWEYIYEQFNSRGMEAKNLIKAEPACRFILPELINEAFEKWQRCEDNYTNINKEFSPIMFQFRHALQLLDFPNSYFIKRENKSFPYKKSTLQKHYDAGEKAGKDSDNQDET